MHGKGIPRSRTDKLGQIAANRAFDVVVLGGGINGIGVFRELSLQGLRVLLVERSDFCSGCSSAPSRMIHGGLRFLENGELSLVREALAERDRLLKTAPHMVRPLPTTIPIQSVFSGLWNSVVGILGGDGKPSHRGVVPIKLGLSVYDWLTRRRRTMPRHKFRGRQATRDQWPGLNDRVRFSVTYHDAWISHPERLGIELIADAERAAPASAALNYATVRRRDDGDLEFVDAVDGARTPITAKIIVNATGAWLDDTRAELASAGERLVAGTKGSHLVIDNPALLAALDGHLIFFENADGRVCIALPYLGRVLVGATDIRVETASRVRCEDDERDYILASLHRLFPNTPLDVADIVFSFSGIRPLPRSLHAFTGRISRGHFTHRIPGSPPQICMIGGKWTTFRAFAEQTCDDVLQELGVPRKCHSHALPIGGGKDFPLDRLDLVRRLRAEFDLDQARATHLVDHYGTQGTDVQAHCAQRRADQPLAPDCAYTAGEIDYLVRHEQVVRLADLALRRTDLAITGNLTPAVLDALVGVAAAALGWSSNQAAAERSSFVDDLQTYHGVCLAPTGHQTDRREQCA